MLTKHSALRNKRKDGLARYQANVSGWGKLMTRGPLVSMSNHYNNLPARAGLVHRI